jgi:hypothetical protein
MVSVGPKAQDIQPTSDLHVRVCTCGITLKHLDHHMGPLRFGYTHLSGNLLAGLSEVEVRKILEEAK